MDPYGELSREQLVERLRVAEAALAAVGASTAARKRQRSPAAAAAAAAAAANAASSGADEPDAKRARGLDGERAKPQRAFDFSKYSQRHIALKIAYLGWDYAGLAVQGDLETIEKHLFAALAKTKLVEDPRTCCYARSGRTDKGVSAFSQVVSLHVRSVLRDAVGVISTPQDESRLRSEELDYVHALNRCLPDAIRVLAWAPVPAAFNARFSTLSRTYKYSFARGALNIERMRDAAQRLVGRHDFRNLCKVDAKAVSNFVRVVLSVSIERAQAGAEAVHAGEVPPEAQMWEFTIRGYAFLWHQIRCIVAVLFLVGEGREEPSVVDTLLDVASVQGKPNYLMASDRPLVLYDCAYEGLDWLHPARETEALVRHFGEVQAEHLTKAALAGLFGQSTRACAEEAWRSQGVVAEAAAAERAEPSYVPLLARPRAPTLAEKQARLLEGGDEWGGDE